MKMLISPSLMELEEIQKISQKQKERLQMLIQNFQHEVEQKKKEEKRKELISNPVQRYSYD